MDTNVGIQEPNLAIVAYEPLDGHVNWKLEKVQMRDIKADELLVRIVATGVCHTDMAFGTFPPELWPYPRILGHEGEFPRSGKNLKRETACCNRSRNRAKGWL